MLLWGQNLAREKMNKLAELNHLLRVKYRSDLSQLKSSPAGADLGLVSKLMYFYSIHTPGDGVGAVMSKCKVLPILVAPHAAMAAPIPHVLIRVGGLLH